MGMKSVQQPLVYFGFDILLVLWETRISHLVKKCQVNMQRHFLFLFLKLHKTEKT